MPLPAVPAWMIDYATAREVFQGNNGDLKREVRKMCAVGSIRFSAYEEKSFKANDKLRGPFCEDQNCRCDLNGEIATIATALPDRIGNRKLHPRDHSAKILVACAIFHNFGIVSVKSGMFLTPVELGVAQGLQCITLAEFAALL